MKFRMVEKYIYWWPVSVRIPDPENPGKFIEQSLKIQFEPQDHETRIAESEIYRGLKTLREQEEHEVRQLHAVCRNWDEVIDDQGTPVPFTPEAFQRAIRVKWFRDAIYKAYGASLNGQEARLGN